MPPSPLSTSFPPRPQMMSGTGGALEIVGPCGSDDLVPQVAFEAGTRLSPVFM